MEKKTPCNNLPVFRQTPPPLFIVLSGPSGAGKDAILSRMKETGFLIKQIITLTTRPKRDKEVDGLDYYFVSVEKFQEMVSRNELLEWANVYGNWYGVPKQPIREALAKGQDIIVKTDVQGAATIKKILPRVVFIFLVPQFMEDLVTRLRQRKTESPCDLALRLQKAKEEIEQVALFDYVVCNRRDEIDQAVSDLKNIIRAEKCRVHPREISIS